MLLAVLPLSVLAALSLSVLAALSLSVLAALSLSVLAALSLSLGQKLQMPLQPTIISTCIVGTTSYLKLVCACKDTVSKVSVDLADRFTAPAHTILTFAHRAQKTSLWGWALGSVCTVVSECYELSELSKVPSADGGQEAWEIKRAKAQAEINTRMIVLVHALFQVTTVLCRTSAVTCSDSKHAATTCSNYAGCAYKFDS